MARCTPDRHTANPVDVSAALAELESLTKDDVADRFRTLYGTDPPRRMRREVLVRAVAHRIHANAGPRRSAGTAQSDTVAADLHVLESMDYAALCSAWRRLYRVTPPRRVSRDLLKLGVAWKLQEQAYGGLGARTRRRLNDLVRSLEQYGDVTRHRTERLKPGARLIREWHGKVHTVMVHDEGFTWSGRQWRSLSMIAREITGARWSGPRFFGIRATKAPRTAGDSTGAGHA